MLYGQPKVHKTVINNIPQFRPILSAINTPVYKLAKYLVPILSPLTVNDYTVKDFCFLVICIKGTSSRFELYYLLKLATSESSFIFDNILYKQIDGVAMGSPLGPTLANAFLCHYEKLWLDSVHLNLNLLYTEDM